jgi:hypothetical protein
MFTIDTFFIYFGLVCFSGCSIFMVIHFTVVCLNNIQFNFMYVNLDVAWLIMV